jgi:DNA-binding NtrC family response regulator
VKLLRVLQDREFEPVGGNETHKVDIRLVLATNDNLEELVAQGKFRQDLYYRVNVITLTQPPLRERISDIPLLVEHYLNEFREQTGKQISRMDDAAMQLLQKYHWPGNVRELLNVIERAVVLSKSDVITVFDLPEALRQELSPVASIQNRRSGGSLKQALANPERQIIIDALENNGWNRQKTSKMLGINRTTLYKKMKRFGIEFEKQLSIT